MDLRDYIEMELAGLERSFKRVIFSLTQRELMWRPASGCNSIGLILFHVAKSEDSFVKTKIQNKPTIWQSEKWYEKLNLAESEEGAHYSVEQVNAFPEIDKDQLFAFYGVVHLQTKVCLLNLTPAEFDHKVTIFPGIEAPLATVFTFVTTHASGHFGEISYLRGLQRGMDK